ncbi:phage holin family protein [Sphingomonas sp. KRR8]|uniref:phage holin family protein n=1 Tax=Sphingomonas sp. KRR8 TaxID=2942996 RepID=UPI00201FDC70|nr:phage holin family protein [Sphingomonas sp. KRR8]URD61314.1 phage holin family protein [Sphingomonas sp. KRR8]
MLKPASPPISGDDSVGDLLHRLVNDGKAYAQAEVAYVKTLGSEKAAQAKQPVIYGVAALLFAHAAFLAVCALIWVGLAQLMNAALAGLLTVIILGAVAGVLGYLAYGGVRKMTGAAK